MRKVSLESLRLEAVSHLLGLSGSGAINSTSFIGFRQRTTPHKTRTRERERNCAPESNRIPISFHLPPFQWHVEGGGGARTRRRTTICCCCCLICARNYAFARDAINTVDTCYEVTQKKKPKKGWDSGGRICDVKDLLCVNSCRHIIIIVISSSPSLPAHKVLVRQTTKFSQMDFDRFRFPACFLFIQIKSRLRRDLSHSIGNTRRWMLGLEVFDWF